MVSNHTHNCPTDLRFEKSRVVSRMYSDLKGGMQTRVERRRFSRVGGMMNDAVRSDHSRSPLVWVKRILSFLTLIVFFVTCFLVSRTMSFDYIVRHIRYSTTFEEMCDTLHLFHTIFTTNVPNGDIILIVLAVCFLAATISGIALRIVDRATVRRLTVRIHLENMPMSEIVFLKDSILCGRVLFAENEYLLRNYGMDR